MLLQWTLLQLASLGFDDGNKNCTGSIPNLTPLIGSNTLIRPPALLSQLLLPNTPAEVSPPPPPQVGCQNHTSEATPVPELSHTTTPVSVTRNTSKAEANIPTATTKSVTTTTPSNDGPVLVPQGGHGDTTEVTTAPALNTTPASEPTTPTSTNGSASMLRTDDGNTPEKTTLASATIPASETTPKQVTEDRMKITEQTADSAAKEPNQPSGDTSQQNEEFYGMQQLLETETTPKQVTEDKMKITKQTADSATKEPNQPSGDTSQRNEEFYGMQQLLETETTPKKVTDDGMKITKQTADSATKETNQPSGDTSQQYEELYGMQQLLETVSDTSQPTSPDITSVTQRSSDASIGTQTVISVTTRADIGIEETTPHPTETTAVPELPLTAPPLPTSSSEVEVIVSGDTQPTEPYETVGISGKDNLISSSANVPELAPGSMATPPRLTSADIILGSSQQGTEPAIVPGISSVPGETTSYVMSGGNVPRLAQQEILGLTPGSGTDISAAANGPVLTPAVVAIPSHVLTTANTGALIHQGTLGLKPESGPVITGSETLPEYPTGVVGLPSHLTAANIAALFPQGIHGLTPGSAHIGNSMHSQIQPAVPLEQVLAPIISALLVKEWQEHPQYRFGRSVNRFETDENSKTSIKEEPQRLPDPQTRYRRAGQLFTRYMIVKSVIDKFLDMRPKTQDFLVKQGVKLTAKKVGEMLKSYGPEIKDWINGRLSSMNVDPSSYTFGDEMDNLVRNIADSLENYIETLPH